MERVRVKGEGGGRKATPGDRAKAGNGGNYFAAPARDVDFIPSGCLTLDLALGGGWAEGRINNIVGDKSTGKTLLEIEKCANFALKYPKGKIRYRESEAAFDKGYAAAIGMPVDRIDFGQQLETVEDLFEDLTKVIEKSRGPELYILDSLDALSDRGEMEREMDAPSYGAEKAKKMSQLFRRLVRKMERKQVTVSIVSQVRDKIGVTFGRKTTRTGGRALDFYSSQVCYLAHKGTEYRTIRGSRRATGLVVKVKMDKNKVGLPFREAEFPILFGYGVDDITACLMYLAETKALKGTDYSKDDVKHLARELRKGDAREELAVQNDLHKLVSEVWYDIERSLMPKRRKYA